MRAGRVRRPLTDTQPATPVQAPSITVAKKQALEALALAQFGLERASAAIEEAVRRLQAVDEAPPARREAIGPDRDDPTPATISPNQLLKLSEVKRLVGLGSSTIYRKMEHSEFPRPLQLGPKTTRWRRSDLDAWLVALQPTTIGRKTTFTTADASLRAARITQRMRRVIA